jgi:hypothetical protein
MGLSIRVNRPQLQVNEVLNNPPPAGTRSSGRGGTAERAQQLTAAMGGLGGPGGIDELGALGSLDQQQLMQLLSLMNQNGGGGGGMPSLDHAAAASVIPQMARAQR